MKQLKGSSHHRPLPGVEPKFPTLSVMSCPNFLNEKGKGEWRRLMSSMAPGLLVSCDRAVLSALSENWARWRQCEEHIEKYGMTITINGQHGYSSEIVSPWVGASMGYQDKMLKCLKEMGMTPASRASVRLMQPPKKVEADPLTPPTWIPPQLLAGVKKKA